MTITQIIQANTDWRVKWNMLSEFLILRYPSQSYAYWVYRNVGGRSRIVLKN